MHWKFYCGQSTGKNQLNIVLFVETKFEFVISMFGRSTDSEQNTDIIQRF